MLLHFIKVIRDKETFFIPHKTLFLPDGRKLRTVFPLVTDDAEVLFELVSFSCWNVD